MATAAPSFRSFGSDDTCVEPDDTLDHGSDQATDASDLPSDLLPTKLVLYVYPDLSDVQTKRRWTGRSHRYTGEIPLKADLALRRNLSDLDPDIALSAFMIPSHSPNQHAELLSRLQSDFDTAFSKVKRRSQELKSCFTKATKLAVDRMNTSGDNTIMSNLFSVVPYVKVEGDLGPPPQYLDSKAEVGAQDTWVY